MQDNDIEMYSRGNKEKCSVAEIFIRTLEKKIYKYMTSVSKNVYIDKLDEVVNTYNKYYSTIEIKLLDVKSKTFINSIKEKNYNKFVIM